MFVVCQVNLREKLEFADFFKENLWKSSSKADHARF